MDRAPQGASAMLFCSAPLVGVSGAVVVRRPFFVSCCVGSLGRIAIGRRILILSESARPAFLIRLTRCESISRVFA